MIRQTVTLVIDHDMLVLQVAENMRKEQSKGPEVVKTHPYAGDIAAALATFDTPVSGHSPGHAKDLAGKLKDLIFVCSRCLTEEPACKISEEQLLECVSLARAIPNNTVPIGLEASVSDLFSIVEKCTGTRPKKLLLDPFFNTTAASLCMADSYPNVAPSWLSNAPSFRDSPVTGAFCNSE